MKFPWDNGYSNIDISSLKRIPMNYESGKLGCGQDNPGFFRTELLDDNITNTFDAIISGRRTGTSRKEKYKGGDLIIFFKNDDSRLLLCRVIESSMLVKLIPKELWSISEGWAENYLELNPSVLNKFQFKFELIKII